MAMTSSRPYMIRAIYEWVLDNNCTPYILVDALREGVFVPQQYVQDGQIVLNISPSAVMGLNVGNDMISFNGRFGGVSQEVSAPVGAVLGVYAKENGQGMLFDAEDPVPPPAPSDPRPSATLSKLPSKSKPSLKVVK
ncbi:ClpXP protease specificity-enhancing factor [Zhongshania sp. BJYM1]|jgi:stringent starvation protein B|uniref:ClpXP protease specificity-enhancing factor n=1 Tax=Zhongshania aquatica TaxID=2965069 RepID=UPI0022B47BBE|nr:ClpXP protease specificity-enhancing factor [Marortus sp. BJYM1]